MPDRPQLAAVESSPLLKLSEAAESHDCVSASRPEPVRAEHPVHNLATGIIANATTNRKRGKSMSFRSGQSGTVVRKGLMWHGRYYVDVPGEIKRRHASMPLGSVKTMRKCEAKRKLRAMLEKMGLNQDSHLQHVAAGAKTFADEAAWW